jgi:hypothetical protein
VPVQGLLREHNHVHMFHPELGNDSQTLLTYYHLIKLHLKHLVLGASLDHVPHQYHQAYVHLQH